MLPRIGPETASGPHSECDDYYQFVGLVFGLESGLKPSTIVTRFGAKSR